MCLSFHTIFCFYWVQSVFVILNTLTKLPMPQELPMQMDILLCQLFLGCFVICCPSLIQLSQALKKKCTVARIMLYKNIHVWCSPGQCLTRFLVLSLDLDPVVENKTTWTQTSFFPHLEIDPTVVNQNFHGQLLTRWTLLGHTPLILLLTSCFLAFKRW